MNDPINFLAQLGIWRLEIRFGGIAVAAVAVVLLFVAAAVGGADAVAWVWGTFFAAIALFVIGCVLGAIKLLIFGPNLAKIGAEGQAALTAASKAIGAGERF